MTPGYGDIKSQSCGNGMKPEPQTLAQFKLCREDNSGAVKIGRAAALWRALELEYQSHWADLQAQYFAKISHINVDQYERHITKYAKAWRRLVNEIDLHGWSLPDPFLAQRFINGLKTYAQSYVQQYLKTLHQGRPRTEVPVINLNELIDDLIRYKNNVLIQQLNEKIGKYNIKPSNIYNFDEKGFLIGISQASKQIIPVEALKTK
ncbi:hypothetical protein PABG_06853 [Paracoccidioides brasiliensis Pb03]|nr:hypothetical protein PABG_06853 [Paracoccidioides brasiliensis Pb03]